MKKANTILLIGIWLGQILVPAGAPAQPAPVQGPIDITANEQEFSGDSVIARGNVHVRYKDSTIVAPQATLFKDPAGNPQRAIFTGHPHLVQGTNKIDSEQMTFELATQKIVAIGNAHSEVEGSDDEQKTETKAPAAVSEKPAAGDDDDDDTDEPVAAKPAAAPVKQAKDAPKKGEKIITDADRQEYDQSTGRFDAMGNVRVKHGDILVLADKLQLVYSTDHKPETAVFTGKPATATQNKNSTSADTLTYSLTTRRLQATGNVRSKVIQEKKDAPKKPAAGPTAKAPIGDIFSLPANATAVVNEKGGGKMICIDAEVDAVSTSKTEEEKPLFIESDAQDYSRDNGRVSAHGHVIVTYGEMKGVGPSVVLLRTPEGQASKVIFQGRSQITQPGRKWIADHITYLVPLHRVIATGNSKAMIIQGPKGNDGTPLSPLKPAAPVSTPNTRLAGVDGETNKGSNSEKDSPSKKTKTNSKGVLQ